MAQLFRMPQPGSTMEEGTIVQWRVKEGETVKAGQPLVDIETDKATLEIEAESDGVLHRILAQAGETVPVHDPIAILGTADELLEPEEGTASGTPYVGATLALPHESGGATLALPSQSALPNPQTREPDNAQRPTPNAPLSASPRAQRIAAEKGVSLAVLAGRGTGPDGRIIERDVLAYLEAQAEISAVVPVVVSQTMAPSKPESDLAVLPAPRLTPMAAKMASDLGVEVADLALGLPGSRVRREDIVRHQEEASGVRRSALPSEPEEGTASGTPYVGASLALPSQSALPNPQTREPDNAPRPTPNASLAQHPTPSPLTPFRKRIAENVTKSALTIPRVTLVLEVDMTECVGLREKILPDFEKGYGVRLSFTDCLLRAVAKSLPDFPLLNASLVGDAVQVHREIHLGIAVAVEEGLLVPVLKNAQSLSLAELAQRGKSLIERAREGKATPDDLSGGTFTVTNLGAFGIDLFDPILVPGQSAILGIGRIAEKPAVFEGQIVPRSLMNLCLSFDHRILDGAPAAQFLQSLKALLETPVRLLV